MDKAESQLKEKNAVVRVNSSVYLDTCKGI